MSGFTRVKSPAALPTYVTITNSNFSANNTPSGVYGSQVAVIDTTFSTNVTGWTKTGGISTGTDTANDVRLLGYLRNNNASPRFWNATPSSSSGNIITSFFVAQNAYSSLPKTFSISQTITIPAQGTYTARFWAAPRTGDDLFGLSTILYNTTQSVAMYVGSDLIGTKTFTQTNNNYPGFELVSGTFATAAANQSRTIRFDWVQTGNNNSAIMITGVEIYKSG
jgi:hypothetical protein